MRPQNGQPSGQKDKLLQLGGGKNIVLGLQREDGSEHVQLCGSFDRAVMMKEECSRIGCLLSPHEEFALASMRLTLGWARRAQVIA